MWCGQEWVRGQHCQVCSAAGWILDFELGLLLSLGRSCPGTGLNRCPSQYPELEALENSSGCHSLHKDSWSRYLEKVFLRGGAQSPPPQHLGLFRSGSAIHAVAPHGLKGMSDANKSRSGWITGRPYKVERWVTANCSNFVHGKYLILWNNFFLCTKPSCCYGSCNFLLWQLVTDKTWAFPFLLNMLWYI